ncbi:Urb2 domain-containing protein [Chloropicon roscoffensis]|uniref:Urb2 domain-containing protein n=1 Tax=Chloropicon roscoffensis TaxID=1461544 RepID=A0AAX4PB00_9CHLO
MAAARTPNPAKAWREPEAFHSAALKCCQELDGLSSQLECGGEVGSRRSGAGATTSSVPFGGHFAVRLRAKQVCRWAAESLGSLAKKRQKSEGRGFHSHALWNAVAKGLQIDGSAADNVTISLVQALGRLARDWSDAPHTDEPGEDEVFLALGSFLNAITVRRSASPSVLSAPFFLSGGTKLALSLLRDAVVCYKRFCSNSDKARLWEDVCVEILRETRSKASSDEMVPHVAGDDDLYFGILSLLDEEVVEGLVKARAGTSGDSKERKLCLGEEVLLWIQELLFPIGCATQYEEWMSGLWEGLPCHELWRPALGMRAAHVCQGHQEKGLEEKRATVLAATDLKSGLGGGSPGGDRGAPMGRALL